MKIWDSVYIYSLIDHFYDVFIFYFWYFFTIYTEIDGKSCFCVKKMILSTRSLVKIHNSLLHQQKGVSVIVLGWADTKSTPC